MAKQQGWTCVKCNSKEYKNGELRTTGSGISRFLNLQNQKYVTVTCDGCGYTELYRADGSGIGNIFDIFTN